MYLAAATLLHDASKEMQSQFGKHELYGLKTETRRETFPCVCLVTVVLLSVTLLLTQQGLELVSAVSSNDKYSIQSENTINRQITVVFQRHIFNLF